jgi:hypothetical protein
MSLDRPASTRARFRQNVGRILTEHAAASPDGPCGFPFAWASHFRLRRYQARGLMAWAISRRARRAESPALALSVGRCDRFGRKLA